MISVNKPTLLLNKTTNRSIQKISNITANDVDEEDYKRMKNTNWKMRWWPKNKEL